MKMKSNATGEVRRDKSLINWTLIGSILRNLPPSS